MGTLHGQLVLPPEAAGAIAIPAEINSLRGVTVTKISKPARAKLLVLHAAIGVFNIKSGNYVIDTFVTAFATDLATAVAHDHETGDGPYQLTTSGTLPDGLSLATNYWIIKISDDTFKFATTQDLALAGTAVDIIDNGTGTHSIGGMPAAILPAASVADGQGAVIMNVGDRLVIPAPRVLTAVAYDAGHVLTYYWA